MRHVLLRALSGTDLWLQRLLLEDKYGKLLYTIGSKDGKKWTEIVGPWEVFAGAYWDGSGEYSRAAHISRISLQLEHMDKDHGFIELNYEFSTMIEDSL